jgi:predicted regulator of amino acid metabolism with ACT domain
MTNLADNGKIDKKVLKSLIDNIEEINKLREIVQEVNLEYKETMQ